MKFAALKRQFLLWGYTSAALVLLLIVGVAVSIWGSSQPPQAIGSLVANLPLGWWRAVSIVCWCCVGLGLSAILPVIIGMTLHPQQVVAH